MTIVKNDLFDYKNRYIFQDTTGFKFSLDSILLGEFVEIKKNDELIVDFCTGNAPVPLLLSTKTDKKIIGFEIQEDIYKLAEQGISYNKLSNQIKIINDDVKNMGYYYKKESFDVVICNPPYFKVQEDSHINTSRKKSLARHEISLTLDDVFNLSFQFLKNHGRLYLVHKADRIDDIIITASKYRVSVKEISLISTKKCANPSIVLVKCIKNSKSGVIISPEVQISGLETYQNIFRR